MTHSPAPERRSRGSQGPRLFERGPFLDEFEALFTRSLPVASRCIAIEGPWGSGRTALINAAADVAGRAGCLVLRAKGGDVELHSPFAVLGRLVESADALSADDKAARDQARTLEGLLGEGEGHDATHIASFFHRLVLSLRRTAPVLLAIDDADRADPETLATLQFLVRRLEHQQIWLVVSARPLHPGVGLRPIDGLLTEPDTRQFLLDPLHAGSVEAILAGFFEEQPDPLFVMACTTATGGSPFLLKALLPSLRRGGIIPTADAAGSVVPVRSPKIAQFVLRQLAQLPVDATDLLQACAILGEDADPTLARQLAGVDAGTAERSAEAAEQRELLLPGRPFRFTAPLIRWAIYHDIPRSNRSELHAAAARLLAAHRADDAAVAGHLLATEPAGDLDTADALQRIGRRAWASGDGGLALRCLERALAESPLSDRRGTLYLDLAAAELTDRGALALTHLRQAVELGPSNGAAAIRVSLDLLKRLSDQPVLRAGVLDLLQGLRTQLADVDRDLRIELELTLALEAERADLRVESLDRLRALLGAPDDDQTPASRLARSAVTVTDVLSSSSLGADDLAAALEPILNVDHLVSAEPMAERVQTMALFGLLCADQFTTVDDTLRSALAHPATTARRSAGGRLSALSALSLSWQGFLVAADEEYIGGGERGEAATTGSSPSPPAGHIDVLVQQGRLEEAERLADSVEPGRVELTLFHALLQIELGRLKVALGAGGPALELFEAAAAAATEAGIVNSTMIPWRAETARVLAGRGEWEQAADLADQHLRLARSFGARRPLGVALRAAAAAAPDLGLRRELLTEAVAVLEASPARLERAHALIDLGTVLIELDHKEEARGILRQGASLASLCGAHQLLEVAGDQLRAAGARPRRLGLVGPESLTPAELRVVRLAADGLTNQRIADDLFVTLKTVEGHLAKAYRKLGVDGRPDLTEALAVREHGDEVDDRDDGELLRASAV